ncbi:MAG TPA: hypothetical protein VIN77_04385 [Aurantimonas sp.]|uniref:Uncharacterized protein n=1 Tax=Aurantimonas marianensis TaxID=2920428 RepID=A0A9X2KEX8_9HYPH|nr:hypothetical protein [Aurantimonas marianensis]MCP3055164.1 hypothetical protein [Aurantimonas marianensis]
MAIGLLTLMAGLAIPFASPDIDADPLPITAELSIVFEFVESEGGYELNALVRDRMSEEIRTIPLDNCATIDIGVGDETILGEPVACDDERYFFDLVGRHVIVSGIKRNHPLRDVEPGYVILNGVPLLVEDEERVVEPAPSPGLPFP